MQEFTATARRLGMGSAAGVVLLQIAYAVTLGVGFLSLTSPQEPIGDPMFSILEMLILAMMPLVVTLMVAVHAWAPLRVKAYSLAALVFTAMLAVVTCGVHFAVLTLRRDPDIAGMRWLLAFEWPSVVYALDVLAWDFLFPLAMFFGAPVFRGGGRLAESVRGLMWLSGLLALAGLSGVVTGNMQLRNIGIAGYVGVFLPVTALLGILFYRTKPVMP